MGPTLWLFWCHRVQHRCSLVGGGYGGGGGGGGGYPGEGRMQGKVSCAPMSTPSPERARRQLEECVSSLWGLHVASPKG